MRERFEAFALTLHPDKTRLIEFGRHVADGAPAWSRSTEDLQLPGFRLHLRAITPRALPASAETRRDRMWATVQEIKIALRDERISRSESRGHGDVHQSRTSPNSSIRLLIERTCSFGAGGVVLR